MVAMIAPNREQQESSIDPRKRETRKRTSKTAAFHTMPVGPIDTTVMWISGLGGVWPATGNDLTNI
jgi:hypothetical protein